MSRKSLPVSGHTAVATAALMVFVLMFLVAQLPAETQTTLLREGGPIETLSAIGYGICIAMMLVFWGLRLTRKRWYFAVLLALFAGRELDLDKSAFTEGVLKSRQYIGDTVSAGERFVSTLILLGIIATLVFLLRRETLLFLRGLRTRNASAYAVLVGLLFIVVYKAIDGLARKLAPFGIDVSQNLERTAGLVEEIGELGIPIMFGLAIVLSSQKSGSL